MNFHQINIDNSSLMKKLNEFKDRVPKAIENYQDINGLYLVFGNRLIKINNEMPFVKKYEAELEDSTTHPNSIRIEYKSYSLKNGWIDVKGNRLEYSVKDPQTDYAKRGYEKIKQRALP